MIPTRHDKLAAVMILAVIALSSSLTPGVTLGDTGEAKMPSAAASAPALILSAELAWEQVYVGDPFYVRVRLTSPRARQDAELRARELERGEAVGRATFTPPAVPADQWAAKTVFQLFQLRGDGKKERVLPEADWASFRAVEKRRAPLPALPFGVLALTEEWIVPPEVFGKLGAGRYLLEVAWLGKGWVDASLLDRDGKMHAQALSFSVNPVTNDRQRAAHEEHLAHFALVRGRYRDALNYGQAALKRDPATFGPQRIHTYLIIGNAAVALKDYRVALATYRELLKRLPPPSHDDLAVAVAEYIKQLERMM